MYLKINTYCYFFRRSLSITQPSQSFDVQMKVVMKNENGRGTLKCQQVTSGFMKVEVYAHKNICGNL